MFSCLKLIFKLAGKLVFAAALAVNAGLVNQQIIVYIHPDHWEKLQAAQARSQWLHDWSATHGVDLSFVRSFGAHGWIIRLHQAVPAGSLRELIQSLNKDPVVEHAEEDAIMTLHRGDETLKK